MKTKFVVLLGVCITVASLLISCAPSPVIPVTGRIITIPSNVSAARELTSNYLQEEYALMYEKEAIPALPAASSWQVMDVTRQDTADLMLYSFKSGDWIVVVRQPASELETTGLTYINTQSGFVWHGEVDSVGNIFDTTYIR